MEGALCGETIVFTGALGIPRQKAADLAANAGCNVVPNVTKKVSILVVGTQDKRKFNGYEKSGKHRKAEALIDKGMDIQILSESDFSELIGVDLPRREERAARTLETIIQDALAGVSEKFGLPINPEAESSVMQMKTKVVVSVWNPLVGFDEDFVESLGEDGKRLLLESRLTLCQGQQDDLFRSVLYIHSKYNDVADMETPEYEDWQFGVSLVDPLH